MSQIVEARRRIESYIYNTPLVYCKQLSRLFKNNIFLKLDSLQVTGSFKIRGVLNYLLKAQEDGRMPSKIVSYSTGNHGIAMGYLAKIFNIQARVYLPTYIDVTKKKLAHQSQAEIIEVRNRQEAEQRTIEDSNNGFEFVPPSDDELVIAGAATMCHEAIDKMHQLGLKADAIFAPCGGGGLLSGSYLAKSELSPETKVYGVEPTRANDAYQSIVNKNVFRFDTSPMTIADGLRALSVSSRTLQYLSKLDDIFLVDEGEIIYWNKYINKILPIATESSASISLAAVEKWSKQQPQQQNIIVLISGGNTL